MLQHLQTAARVAEMADALDSKSSNRKIVWVQVPPLAPLPKTFPVNPGLSTDNPGFFIRHAISLEICMSVQEYQIRRDRLAAALSQDGKFRVVLVKNTTLAQTAQQKHQLPQIAMQYLARAMTAGSLLASLLKGEERIGVIVSANGPIQRIIAEAMQVGEVRGYVRMQADGNIQECQNSLGQGTFRIEKICYGQLHPTVGMVDLKQGDLIQDFEDYLNHSEQIPSAVQMVTQWDSSGSLKLSGGLMLQAMPGTKLEEIQQLAQSLKAYPLEELLQTCTNDQILQQILPSGLTLTNNTLLDFHCRCSLQRFKQFLATLSLEEIQDMQQQNHREMVCQYCSQEYILTDQDFAEIQQHIQNPK